MAEPTPAPASSRRKIRLTRAEAHALRLAAPRKRGIAFGTVALLLAVALGAVLWYFRDFWIPYWIPEKELSSPAAATVPIETPSAVSASVEAPKPVASPVPTATVPETPESLGPSPAGETAPAGETSAPVPTRLVAPPPPEPGGAWQEPDYLEGAKLFNQALAQYQLFLADKTRTELLKPIEEAAFQAAKKFEALKGQAPAGVPLNENIAQCYKLISDCRRQNLERAGSGTESGRRTVGPHRRPALPPYQSPQAH